MPPIPRVRDRARGPARLAGRRAWPAVGRRPDRRPDDVHSFLIGPRNTTVPTTRLTWLPPWPRRKAPRTRRADEPPLADGRQLGLFLLSQSVIASPLSDRRRVRRPPGNQVE